MSKHTHTPGPWFSIKNGAYKWVESPAHTVCVFYQWNSDGSMSESEDAEANARLISAAPDLLAALEYIISDVEPTEFALSETARAMANAAISKAKGEA